MVVGGVSRYRMRISLSAPDIQKKSGSDSWDVYMAKFKEIFGTYPKSIGSWFIDIPWGICADDHRGVVQLRGPVGTDRYTLWGGYWNQAYYPSRVNVICGADERRIPVPIFRMLGQ